MGLFSSNKDGGERQTSAGRNGKQSDSMSVSNQDVNSSLASAPEYRPVFLLVWPSALFKAHWAFFIPDLADKTYKKGKYIHVTGSLAEGFSFEIARGWDISKTRSRPYTPIEIGWLRADLIKDQDTNGQLIKESIARDQLEEFLTQIAPPPKTLKSAGTSKSADAKSGKKAELSDCQWWVVRCVEALVQSGLLIAPMKGLNKGVEPLTAIAKAPRN